MDDDSEHMDADEPARDIQISPNPAARRAKVAAILESQVQACDNVMGDVYTWLRSDLQRNIGGSDSLKGMVSLAQTCAQLAAMLDRLEPLPRQKAGSIPQESC